MPRNKFLSLFDRVIRPIPGRFTRQPIGSNELPPLRRGHYHVCRCGNYLACITPSEFCPVSPAGFDCPTCEQNAADAHFTALAANARVAQDGRA